MDLTQVGLGLVLVAVGAVTFASPTVLDSTLHVSILALATLVVAGGAFLVGTVRDGAID
ncbi:hypothetical protein [Natrialbaceae archaeon AArc-T1-2]|uniref:hypothetical protein n=1 Tax=Natrialbaceae archaeon AArc-T1-2 TaxID=3053904 RepID=UPI00255AB6E4|nr:hypothetical protein [Natrialbaceae archaeon AArc-T1-2]WIV68108.1 hypothetical protein QQ977_05100 [Natrialbaceae archaeon AArc-T1-2]